MPVPTYTLTDGALHALLSCSDAEARYLLPVLEPIAFETDALPDFRGTDARDRPLLVRSTGGFLIMFHARSGGAPAHIVDIRKI
jgi:hypothetical protein